MENTKNQTKRLKIQINKFKRFQFLGLSLYLIVSSVQKKSKAKKVKK